MEEMTWELMKGDPSPAVYFVCAVEESEVFPHLTITICEIVTTVLGSRTIERNINL
jgi:hypothetical protein